MVLHRVTGVLFCLVFFGNLYFDVCKTLYDSRMFQLCVHTCTITGLYDKQSNTSVENWVKFKPMTHCILSRCSTNRAIRAAQLAELNPGNATKQANLNLVLHAVYRRVCTCTGHGLKMRDIHVPDTA